MQIHELQRTTRQAPKKRVGRGGKRGKTAGRGHKGQKARAGHKIRPEVRDTIKKLPKLRGYRFNSIQKQPIAVNVGMLARVFSDGEIVNRTTLREKKVIGGKRARTHPIKILGNGSLDVSLVVEQCAVSKNAEEKITNAGGKVNRETSGEEKVE